MGINNSITLKTTIMKEENIAKYGSWFYCQNLVCHEDQVALIRMSFPRVFLLFRRYSDVFSVLYSEFEENVDIQFFDPRDRENADVEEILREAWNFLSLEQKERDKLLMELEY